MQNARERERHEIGPVFWVSAAFALAFILWGVIGPQSFGAVTQGIFEWVVGNLGWFYLLAGNFFLIFVVVLALSRYGKLRLGKEGERPQFSRFAWFAMLFQAGMGPALIFWGVAEPLAHYNSPPFGLAEPGSVEAAQVGMQYTYFHWAFHPWAMYAIVGLAVGYFSFRRDEPGLISPVFRPLLGNRVDGPIGKTIDVLSVIAVLFGVAVALGQAGLQLTAGLGETFGTPTGIIAQITVIVVTTVAFIISASTAIEKGINYLSQISLYLAGVLLVFFLFLGPTATQLGALTQGVGDYAGGIVPMSMRLNSFDQDNTWLGSWTVFYWSWWIAWCPYVGLFIARISRGRTIREFVLGTVLGPSVVTFVWVAVFGGTAIFLDRTQADGLAERVVADPAAGMFLFLDQFPLALPLSILTLAVLWIFFVAGADAGTVVLGSLSTGGPQEPVRWIKVAWGLAMAAIAGILLVAGGLGALQSASVLTGVPFAFIMFLMCISFLKHLRSEARGGGLQGSPGGADAARAREEAPSTRRAPSGRPAPGRPATGSTFTAEPLPDPRGDGTPGINEPGTGGR
ncbi:BCCT family transporter [Rubrobacter marinus]|uniref:BCCT family transporter n=1 Tax=Rubrobacter marinus TaxID=2653852 RepID=A0A6G8Q0F0_9ACTN|nr:BCCT family transporter [Rubrobacter marinus]QIN79942.1 BCCT family transporter [Rubrobacter marinus]